MLWLLIPSFIAVFWLVYVLCRAAGFHWISSVVVALTVVVAFVGASGLLATKLDSYREAQTATYVPQEITVVDTESAATLATIEGRCTVDELENSIEVICSVGEGKKRLVFENASYKISSGRGKVSDDYYRVEYPADTPSE